MYGNGATLLRASIVKSATLHDRDCRTKYELPFQTASSYDLPKEKKIAWVRGLRVDERLTVIAAAPNTGLQAGDHIVSLDGYQRENAVKMQRELERLRDGGRPFPVKLAGGSQAAIKAASDQAAAAARRKLLDSIQNAARASAQDAAVDSIKAAILFSQTLTGVVWVASTGFYMAHRWALERMAKVDTDPLWEPI